MKAILIASLLLAVTVVPASAQSLKLPTRVFLASAAADWSSTAYCLSTNPNCHETNPMLRWAEPAGPVAMVGLGAAADLGSLYVIHKLWGRNHPKIMRVALYSYAAVRGSVAVANVHAMQRH